MAFAHWLACRDDDVSGLGSAPGAAARRLVIDALAEGEPLPLFGDTLRIGPLTLRAVGRGRIALSCDPGSRVVLCAQ